MVSGRFWETRNVEVDDGFTLIELVVVMAILGILIAIALPTYLGVIDQAHNTSAASSLANSYMISQEVFLESKASYPTPVQMVKAMKEISTTYTFTTGISKNVNEISVATNGTLTSVGTWVSLANLSPDGNCYYILDNSNTSSVPGQGVWYSVQGFKLTSCSAIVPPTWPTSNWSGWSNKPVSVP